MAIATLVLLLIPVSATACGTLEVGIERNARPAPTATATPSDLATPGPTVTASPARPTVAPTSTPLPDPASYLDVEREGGELGGVWNLADLRYGLHSDRVQIVWEMTERRDHTPFYQVIEVDNAASPFPTGHDPSWGEARIDLIVSDLYARDPSTSSGQRSPILEQLPLTLPDDPLVTRIGSYATFSDAHLGFSIGLGEPAAYAVYELTDPVRIVIAVFYPPGGAPAPQSTPTSTIVPTPVPHLSSTPARLPREIMGPVSAHVSVT
jgi:hypothetical protein